MAGGDRLALVGIPAAGELTAGPVLVDARLVDEQVYGRKREHLSISRLKEPPHIFAAHLEAPAGNARNHIIVLARLIAEGA